MPSYSYDCSRVPKRGRDRMRFELGDTGTGGDANAAMLTDEEIDAIIASAQSWNAAKLVLATSVLRRLSFEVDQSVGPISMALSKRCEAWRRVVHELTAECSSGPSRLGVRYAYEKPAYFYAGMLENQRAGGEAG